VTFPGRWTRVRIVACGVVLVALFVAVGKRAFNLQVREAERLRAMAEEQYLREVELPPRRGRILDRNGAELASTADVDSIYCNPRRLPDPADAARRLARALGIDRRELEKKLQQRRFFTWVKRKVTPDEAAAVKALALPGVAFVREPRRFYPNRSLAATVMGLAGSDGRGLDGVELALDKQLTGTTSSVVGIRDALGRDLAVEGMPDTPTGVGSDVVLTIDRYLTFVTERAIADGQARTHAKDIVAIVMNPQTGELLAMASVPTFNPNDPSEAAGARDRAITDAYEPGSTMKTFTIASALEAGVVRADDRFDCLQGKMMVGKYSIHDTHPHGVLTVAEVFKFSSNIGATKIARRLGREGLADALGRFGFGSPTGVGLPGERSGVIRPVDKWGDIGFANVSFGQGLTVTPLQMVTGVSAIAAGGLYHAPRVVLRVVQPDGTVEAPAVASAASDRRVMAEPAARTMLGIMRGVTEEGGTAKQAAIDGYVVGGKTGTAQKVSNGHYDPNKWVSSFVGVVPIEAPRLAIIVVVDEPQGGHLGGAVAAPIFKEIAEQALRYLHVPPSIEPTVAAAKPAKASPKAAADADDTSATSVEAPPTELPVYADSDGPGDDPALAEQWNAIAGAEGGSSGRGGPAAPAPTSIPNFAGMTMGEAIRAAHKSGVELDFDDATGTASGVVLAQNPAPGPSSRGALCRVALGRRE
jgi:cell division protein FtsI (penicillin-binding protein 3)